MSYSLGGDTSRDIDQQVYAPQGSSSRVPIVSSLKNLEGILSTDPSFKEVPLVLDTNFYLLPNIYDTINTSEDVFDQLLDTYLGEPFNAQSLMNSLKVLLQIANEGNLVASIGVQNEMEKWNKGFQERMGNSTSRVKSEVYELVERIYECKLDLTKNVEENSKKYLNTTRGIQYYINEEEHHFRKGIKNQIKETYKSSKPISKEDLETFFLTLQLRGITLTRDNDFKILRQMLEDPKSEFFNMYRSFEERGIEGKVSNREEPFGEISNFLDDKPYALRRPRKLPRAVSKPKKEKNKKPINLKRKTASLNNPFLQRGLSLEGLIEPSEVLFFDSLDKFRERIGSDPNFRGITLLDGFFDEKYRDTFTVNQVCPDTTNAHINDLRAIKNNLDSIMEIANMGELIQFDEELDNVYSFAVSYRKNLGRTFQNSSIDELYQAAGVAGDFITNCEKVVNIFSLGRDFYSSEIQQISRKVFENPEINSKVSKETLLGYTFMLARYFRGGILTKNPKKFDFLRNENRS